MGSTSSTHSSNEGGDEGNASLGTGDGLGKAEQKGQVAVDALLLEISGGLDTLPGGSNLDQNSLSGDTGLLVKSNDLSGLGLGGLCVVSALDRIIGPAWGPQCDSPASKENRASTSVETRPGTILRISFPNSTSKASMAFSACSSRSLHRRQQGGSSRREARYDVLGLFLAKGDGGVDDFLVGRELGSGEAGR